MLAAIFHFHQKIIKQFPIRGFWLWLCDLGVWLVAIPLVFVGLLIINEGEVRFYVLLALLTGGGLYMLYVKPIVNRFVGIAASYTAKTIRAIFSFLTAPWRLFKARFKTSPPPGNDG